MDQDEIRPNTLGATTITGHLVRDKNGEEVGRIDDVLIDLESGCIAYAVLTFDTMFPGDTRLFAVPWEALTLSSKRHHFILEADRPLLTLAPGFERDQWPDATYEWLGEIYAYYGLEPYWEDDDEDDFDFGFFEEN